LILSLALEAIFCKDKCTTKEDIAILPTFLYADDKKVFPYFVLDLIEISE